MGSNPQQPGSTPPPKPWERDGTSSGPAPFKPPSSGSTSNVVEASKNAETGEVVSVAQRNSSLNRNNVGRPVPPRPWEANYGNNYGNGSNVNYNSAYGTGMYGANSSYGGNGGSYNGRIYGDSMYNGGGYGGSAMYGGGMYSSGFGGPIGSYGLGMGGPPYGGPDPNNPNGPPPSPPGFWMSFIQVMQGVVNCFARISILIDQNAHAFHMFMTALLQLFDRSGLLYGEIARFALRILGLKPNAKKDHEVGTDENPGRQGNEQQQPHVEVNSKTS